MNRRELLLGVAASALLPAIPASPPVKAFEIPILELPFVSGTWLLDPDLHRQGLFLRRVPVETEWGKMLQASWQAIIAPDDPPIPVDLA